MTSRMKTQRPNKPSPINPLFQNHHHQELTSPPSSLGSNSGTLPFSSISPSSTTHYYSTRPRAKSVGKVDQRQLAREESFLKLCGQLTPPPPPPPPLSYSRSQHYPPSQPIKKYPSAHDLKKNLQHQKYNIDLHHHIPLPHSPISPNRDHYYQRHLNKDDDDSDDDIPLAMKHQKIKKQPFLLNDDQEEDDSDLIPIGKLKSSKHHPHPNESMKSAADKYKEKVKEYLYK
ncbi:unnamed protein product [Cunninghamella blakesleeana]